jgi:3-oxo-5-alpha-steroid 4-dehydrogenase 1
VPAHYAAGYHIPRGGLFEYVSAANYSAEILEWSGYALAAWRLPAAAFAWFTFCNLAPRGLAHHQWYLQKFGKKYPRQRKAVIPFIW